MQPQKNNPNIEKGPDTLDSFDAIAAPAVPQSCAQDTSKPSILDLPSEMRLAIYKKLLNSQNICGDQLRNLRATCRQVQQELDYEVVKTMRVMSNALNDAILAGSCYEPTRTNKRAVGEMRTFADTTVWKLWLPMSSLLRVVPHPDYPLRIGIFSFDVLRNIRTPRIRSHVQKIVLQYYQDFGNDSDLRLRRLQDFLKGLVTKYMFEFLSRWNSFRFHYGRHIISNVYEIRWAQDVGGLESTRDVSYEPRGPGDSGYEILYSTVTGTYKKETDGTEKEGIVASRFTVGYTRRVE